MSRNQLNSLLLIGALLVSCSVGFAQDTTRSPNKGKAFVKALILPAVLAGAAAYSVQYKYQVANWRNENFPNFKTNVDDWLQYVPVATVYTLSFSGVKGKHDLANQTALLCKSAVLMTAFFFALKYTNTETRPDGHDNASWPSGHTEQAFAAASFLHKEYGYKSVWYTIGGYTCATTVGVLRILNNKHYLPDVLAGAAAGVLATNLVYLTHKNRWGKNKTKRKQKTEAFIMPTYNRVPGLYFCLKIK